MSDQIWQTSDNNLSLSIPEFICPIHGNIGNSTIEFYGKAFGENQGYYCLVCYAEILIKNGLQKVIQK